MRTEDNSALSGEGAVDFKKARVDREKEPEKSKKENQMDEFLEVMKPRKGPSWANEIQPEASTSAKKIEDEAMDVETTEGLSDMDWMRKHISKNVDAVEKAYEQSDDEDAEEQEVLFTSFSTAF